MYSVLLTVYSSYESEYTVFEVDYRSNAMGDQFREDESHVQMQDAKFEAALDAAIDEAYDMHSPVQSASHTLRDRRGEWRFRYSYTPCS